MVKKFIAFSFLLLGLVSCEKEALYGPEGDPGISGQQGSMGDDYEFYSEEFFVSGDDWQQHIPGDPLYLYDIALPILTQEVIDRSLITVYLIEDGKTSILPFKDADPNNSIRHVFFVIDEGVLHMKTEDTKFYLQRKDMTFKVVVIQSAG